MDKKLILDTIQRSGLVPVAVLEKAEDAVPLARAMYAGGIDVIEVTFRTAAAEDSIRAINKECPEMLLGAGTVTCIEQCQRAVDCGAAFIVCPGFVASVVEWCIERDIPVIPGCVTPSEIMSALSYGLKVLKFFPANVYGGLAGIKALSGPFPGVRFMPTGGITVDNIGEYIRSPFIFAVGGTWVCQKTDIENGRFQRVTELCKQARKSLLGFELLHVGINGENPEAAREICDTLERAFGFEYKPGNTSDFASSAVEVKKVPCPGEHGHIAIGTNSVVCAMDEMRKSGFQLDESSLGCKNGRPMNVFLKTSIGGFAYHFVQK